MAHIGFVNFPAVGHLNPTLGLVAELVRRGHRVTATATDHFVPAIEAAGAEPVRYRSEFGDFYRSPFTAEALQGEGLRTLDEALTVVEQLEPGYQQDRPDLIVHDFMAWGARFLAARNDIPTVRTWPTYGVHEKFNIAATYPLAQFSDEKVMEMLGKLTNVLPEFNLPADPMAFFQDVADHNIIFLPREFHYEGDSFDERWVFAGPCLTDRSAFQGSWRPADPDRPVLLISLGTAATGWPEFFPIAMAAFGGSEWDVVMAAGDHADSAELGAVPANFTVRRHVPQLDVLEHATLFVTHGGMNSTMEALYYGVPMVVIPQMNEQKANGMRVQELGLGRHLAADETTVDSLRNAAAAVAGDAAITENLARMRDAIRAVDGPRVAADAVEARLTSLG
ncbi:MAG TPA: macrolide family glycosyltransferase [Actinophytocola sp.]|uniref:macrolide family glycosyltransferase n=1 Tax=Actinophytocola sp. TaxID=1872138 RepID=UPI002DBB84ED|nr:macrolide family glycosyltransferase [Actinophytocola sp.]HEU5474635.1 macrolide family glycosyltransferase [Actinophytocola sp.]